MKLFIRHTPNTYNYGSMMMAENLIYYLNELGNISFEFNCDFSSLEDRNRMEKATKINNLRIDYKAEKKLKGNNKLMKAISLYKNIRDEVRNYVSNDIKAIIILGGDDLSEYYAGKGIAVELFRLAKLSKKMNVYLAGQTIGPFYSWRVPLAKRFLKSCYIYTRDPLSARYLINKLKLKKVKESRDLAWLDLSKQNDNKLIEGTMKKYKLESQNYITLVPSGLFYKYTNNRKKYIESWIRVITLLNSHNELKSIKMILLSHVLKPKKADDRKSIKSIMEKIDNNFDVIPITDELLPVEARAILGNGLFTITGRMHAAISTFQMLKPAISLSYSVKYRGVIGEGLGMKDLVIEAKGDELWESGKIVDMVTDKVNYVLANYDKLTERIKPAVEESKKMALEQIKDIAKKIEKGV